MHRVLRSAVVWTVAVWMAGIGNASAQDLAAADRAPRFYLASATSSVLRDASGVALLRRRIAVDLDRTPLDQALEAITTRASLRLVYSRDLLPRDARVTLKAANITVTAALTEVLLDAGLDVIVSLNGQMTLVKRLARQALVAPGSVAGRVTDGKTGERIVGAEVFLDGTRWRATTGENGYYRLDDVEAGNYTLAVRRVGYAKQSKTVAVTSAQEATVDVALQPVVTQLNEIVTTVTGDRQMRELGHVIGRINADSLVKEAPISNVTELLTGRVPGLQVFQAQGIVGGDVQLQIRTPNSLMLGTQPIVIVDGVRYTSAAVIDFVRAAYANMYNAGTYNAFNPTQASQVEPTSPLNDLNPNDIESIEVVKGSSAATLYGTDAANGVIVVTTKRGRPGPARWNAYVRAGFNETPDIPIPKMYWAWGSYPNGVLYNGNCTLAYVAIGQCVQDSITTFGNLFDNPSQTILSSAPQTQYGMSFSGGTPGLRYYVAGSLDRETGSLQMPQALIDSIEQARGAPLPKDQLRPNALSNINLRSNLMMALKRFDLQGNLGYVRRTNRTVAVQNPYAHAGELQLPKRGGWGFFTPDAIFSRTSTEQVDRFLFGGDASWRPTAWLQARGAAGVDVTGGVRQSLERRGETYDPRSGTPNTGEVQSDRTQQRSITGNVSLVASFRRGRMSSRTSAGAQYVRSVNDAQLAWGTDLVPGGESVPQAANRYANQLFSETVTLGSYVEQTFGLNDRLYVTGALRSDGASNFGQDYEAAAYPKASVSWILSEEPFLPRIPGLSELRLRYAYGRSGQQAYAWMARPTFAALATYGPLVIEGTTSPLIDVTALGNPALRPERSGEHEFGFDAAGLDSRVQVGLTWYRRRVTDQIVSQTLPTGLGMMYRNVGLTTARGFEATFNATLLESRPLSWHVSVNHSSSSTLLVEAGESGLKEGYPLGASFGQPIVGYTDPDGDGILLPWQVQRTDTLVYLGQTVPGSAQSLSTTFGFFDGRIRLSASFQHSAGNVLPARNECAFEQCLALLDPGSSIEEQFKGMVSREAPVHANFTRLQEMTLLAELPAGLLSKLRVRSGTLSVSARNLALWTSFPSGDPGSLRLYGSGAGGGTTLPQARSWTFRLDLGL